MPSLRTTLFSFFALLMAARNGSAKPSRAIFSTSKLALPLGGFKNRTGLAPELQDLQSGVNQHAGRGETLECDAIRLALRLGVVRGMFPEGAGGLGVRISFFSAG